MSSEENNLRTTTIGTVVGGLILAAILAFVPKAWACLLWITKWIGAILAFRFTIPVWAILIAIVCAILGARIASGNRSDPPLSRKAGTAKEVEEAISPLSAMELSVIGALVKADGQAISVYEIAYALGSSKLLIEQAIENLNGRGMLMHSRHWQGHIIFRLSSEGRDFAIASGFVH